MLFQSLLQRIIRLILLKRELDYAASLFSYFSMAFNYTLNKNQRPFPDLVFGYLFLSHFLLPFPLFTLLQPPLPSFPYLDLSFVVSCVWDSIPTDTHMAQCLFHLALYLGRDFSERPFLIILLKLHPFLIFLLTLLYSYCTVDP